MDESRDGPLASSAMELGQGMRRMMERRGWTLRDMEKLQKEASTAVASRSLLSQLERGTKKKLPSVALAKDLDRLYCGESWIHMSVVALSQRTWSPWDGEWPKEDH